MTVIAALPLFSNSSLNPQHAYSKVQVTLPPGPIQVGPERVNRQLSTYCKQVQWIAQAFKDLELVG